MQGNGHVLPHCRRNEEQQGLKSKRPSVALRSGGRMQHTQTGTMRGGRAQVDAATTGGVPDVRVSMHVLKAAITYASSATGGNDSSGRCSTTAGLIV